MHLDKYGLPVQADGDANDQLQRVGMILVASAIENGVEEVLTPLEYDCAKAVDKNGRLRHKDGVFIRCTGSNPDNVSADQLIAILGAFVAIGATKNVIIMLIACLKRFGFAQNYKDGLNGTSTKTKLPDFMLIRALPLFLRIHWCLYPFLLAFDAVLVLSALSACGPVWKDGKGFAKRGPDDVDDNNTIITLAVSRHVMPTFFSYLATRIFAKLRPWNYGCQGDGEYHRVDKYVPVYGALRWYHRAEAGGNPEIAELWKPICERYFQ